MTRFARRFGALAVFALTLLAAPYAYAQKEGETPGPEGTRVEQNTDPWIWWKLANFVILVGVLGYLIRKKAAGYFDARTEQIHLAIAESAKAKREADEHVSLMERRMAGLAAEIERMRAAARAEMAAEGERIRQETERHIHKLQQQTGQEIENMSKAARKELKLYSAGLALKLAEQQIAGRVTSDVENTLVQGFIDGLRDGGSRRSMASE